MGMQGGVLFEEKVAEVLEPKENCWKRWKILAVHITSGIFGQQQMQRM
jgi:hypothetical protein